jgi:hypothetical protein
MNTYTTAEGTIPLFSKRLQELHCKEFLVWIVSRGFVAFTFDRPERVSVLQVKQVTERDVVTTLALQTTWKNAMSKPYFPLHHQVFGVQWKSVCRLRCPSESRGKTNSGKIRPVQNQRVITQRSSKGCGPRHVANSHNGNRCAACSPAQQSEGKVMSHIT